MLDDDLANEIEEMLREFKNKPWPDPEPIETTLLPFPVEALPGILQNFVKEAARATHIQPDFFGNPLIGYCGGAIGTTRQLALKKGYVVYPSLWQLNVGLPGSGKSVGTEKDKIPLVNRQVALSEETAFNDEIFEAEKLKYEANLADWKKIKSNIRGEPPKKPQQVIEKTCITDDTTMEKLADILQENPRGAVCSPDEAIAWILGMNQYKKQGSDRGRWLSFWSCYFTKVDRKSKKRATLLQRPFCPIISNIQPDLLPKLYAEKNVEDGFVHRILFSFPNELPPPDWDEEEISALAINALNGLFENLFNLTWANENKDPVVLSLTLKAKKVWADWFNKHNKEAKEPDFDEGLRGPWAKMPLQFARIALIIHVVRFVSGETTSNDVDETSMFMTWALVDYYKSHARKVYSFLLEPAEDKKVKKIVSWAKKHSMAGITPRDLYINGVSGINKSSEAIKALKTLGDMGLAFQKNKKWYFI
ncbi:MAG TPA: hypothetical protein DD719_06850 [Desulfotomaculum sp.]|nr:hypothetical protein [Desulfotomaculum sp.]